MPARQGDGAAISRDKASRAANKRIYEVIAVFLLLLAAAILRDVYLLQYEVRVPYYQIPIIDSAYYDAWASRVAEGKGYGSMPFYMAPLYPYVLALIYMVAGHNLTIAYLFQEALAIFNLLLVYLLGRRLFGHVSGLIGAGLIILYAPLMYLESKLLTEPLAIALNLTSLLLLMRALDRPTVPRYLAAGIMLGLSALCRPVALITIALVLAWFVLRTAELRRGSGFRLRHLAVLALGIALTILPITARNYFVGQDFALIGTNVGIVFAQANNPSANGVSLPLPGFTSSIETQQEEEMDIAARALGHPLKASESSAFWFRYGLRFIREQPGKFIKLLGAKFIWSLHNREAGCSYNVHFEKTLVPVLRYLPLPFSIFAGLGLLGLVRSRRKEQRSESELLALQVISVFLSLIVFSVSSRYRVPAVPILAIFAGVGLTQVASFMHKRDLRGIAAAAACVGLISLFSLAPYPIPPVMADAPGNLGAAHLANGSADKAIVYLKKALAMNPDSSLAHYNMGNALLAKRKLDEAVLHYQRAVEIRPDDETMRLGLGNALAKQGKFEDAMRQYSKILQINPRSAEGHTALGAALAAQKRTDEAIQEYREAVRIKPDLAVAHYNLAAALYSKGEYSQAWDEVRLCRKYGWNPSSKFLQALAAKMPEPKGSAPGP